ncbi:MFS transporter [Planctomyces sp. SH-PL62]|uniref:MFS transporter n=1 Tax=Planctomyces sp. SH-PL62 TaxID=1636152 RepID=UPI00078EBF10|nr:MFS transporter [Planctomyces sp. SH-PL62]AMV37782.1 Putative sialic acid transporter [Planctomyces sp. SH-PL62]
MGSTTSPESPEAAPSGGLGLSSAHWWILAAAALGWLFDAMDQRLFILARTPALRDLSPATAPADLPTLAGWATALFIAGWATGGLVFGLIGDRYGRVRTMGLTILMYSVFTGLSGLAQSWPEFAAYRFLCGMGIGGEYAAGVALVAEAMPTRWRALALGMVQAASSIGAMIGSGLSVLIGPQSRVGGYAGWRLLFFFGVFPSVLLVLLRLRVPEPDRWLRARDEARRDPRPGRKMGDVREIFADPVLRRRTLIGMTLGMVGQVGLWSIGLYTPELVRDALFQERRTEVLAEFRDRGWDASAIAAASNVDQLAHEWASREQADPAPRLAGWKAEADGYVGWGTLLQDVGSLFGAPFCTWIAIRFGRRRAFATAYAMALASVWLVFLGLSKGPDVYWMLPLLGFCTCGIFGVIVVYLPELYPTRLRTTGMGFCYNMARYLTAAGPVLLGRLALGAGGYSRAALIMSSIYVLGLIVVPFAPETRGQPLPD